MLKKTVNMFVILLHKLLTSVMNGLRWVLFFKKSQELAAFLHSRGDELAPKVIIKPTSAGAAYLVQTLACAVGAVIISP